MSLLVQYIDLIDECRGICDLDSSDHIELAEWKRLFARVYRQFHRKMVNSGGRYFEQVDDVTAASLAANGDGGGSVNLPAGHYGTMGVYFVDASGEWCPLWEMMAQDRHVFSSVTGATDAQAYALVGSNPGKLILYPKPATGTYKHAYVPQPTDLSGAADATQVDVINGDGHDYLIWGVARLATNKEEDPELYAIRAAEWERADVALGEAAQDRAILNLKVRHVDWGREVGDEPYDPADYHLRRY